MAELRVGIGLSSATLAGGRLPRMSVLVESTKRGEAELEEDNCGGMIFDAFLSNSAGANGDKAEGDDSRFTRA